MVAISVLFSTFNGAATLSRMLDALEALDEPAGGWKLIAVDNGSTDETAHLLRQRQTRLPLSLVSEPRRGKNFGLNTGLESIEGDLVVLTDDDVIPRKDWLVSTRRLVEEQPDFDIFGGAIRPAWPSPPPAWILRCAPKGHFAWTEFEEGPADPRSIWGPNMAIRRSVFAGRRFFEGIGPNGGARYATGSEVEFVVRASQAGHRCWHSEHILVEHIIEARQMTMRWLLQRSYNQARGERRLRALGADDAGRAWSTDGFVGRYAGALAALARAIPTGGIDRRFVALHQLSALHGELAERRFQAQARRLGAKANDAAAV
jgi:glycosyltransferase involved in cell wall biosynthesis